MKKISILFVVVLVGTTLFGTPADNFKKSSKAVSGYASLNLSFDNFLSDEYKSSYKQLYINPSISQFIQDNVSMDLSGFFSMRNNKETKFDSDYSKYVESESNYIYFGFDLGGTYYLPLTNNTYAGVGASLGLNRYQALDGKFDGQTEEDKYSNFGWSFLVSGKYLYFLTDRVALVLKEQLTLSSYLSLTSSNGDAYEYADDYKHQNDLKLESHLFVGLSVYIPYSQKFLLK